MSKYKCKECGGNAHYDEFYKSEKDSSTNAVYAYCSACGKEAWGGLRFHPEMNNLFNKLFEPNLAFKEEDQHAFARRIALQTDEK